MSGLIVENLVAGVGRFRFGPLSLTAAPGSLTALVGPNGGGKSTVLRTLLGSLQPISGRIVRPSDDPAGWAPPPGMADIGLTAGHLAALGAASRRRGPGGVDAGDRAEGRAALSRLGIADLADRPLDRLSSGQRQLATIARLLAQRAPLCLLDEPTAMLDSRHTAEVVAAIRALAAGGAVVVLATHDLKLARACDEVATIGPTIQVGPPTEILTPGAVGALYGLPATT